MRAIVLAGGAGNRSHPLGVQRPKSLFPLIGRPLIGWVLEALADAGVPDAVIVTGPGEGGIRTALGDRAFGVALRYATQASPRGQADALRAARAEAGDGPVLVLNANDAYDPRVLARVVRSVESGGDVVLVGRRTTEPERFGIMVFDGDEDSVHGAGDDADPSTAGGPRLVGVVEKPPRQAAPSDVAVVGVYGFSHAIWAALDATPDGPTDDAFERAYGSLIARGSAKWLPYDGPFASFKHPWDVLAVGDVLFERARCRQIDPTARISDSAVIDGDVILAAGVRVFEHAVIRGPAYLGPGCIVGNGALIRGGVSLGAHCVVGYRTEISHSMIGDHTWTHMNYVGDSVIGDNCSLGAGTITANLRFDEGPIRVAVGDEIVSTGRPYFGVIMADDCRTGCNAVLLPGRKIGPNSIVGPGVVLDADLPPGMMATLAGGAYTLRDNPIDVSALSRADRMRAVAGS